MESAALGISKFWPYSPGTGIFSLSLYFFELQTIQKQAY